MLTEIYVVFQRQMRILLRNPVWVFFGLTQPILYLILFGPLLKRVTGGGLGGNGSWASSSPACCCSWRSSAPASPGSASSRSCARASSTASA